MNAEDGYWLGLDLGGTGTRLAVVDAHGAHEGIALATEDFAEHAVERLEQAAAQVMPTSGRLLGVGIGSSGPVDLRTGEIHNDDTLPQFTRKNIVGALAERLQVPVWIDNDAVVAALAEFEWGFQRRFSSLLCITLGTGLGVALIDHGSPLRAADGQHPESGHISVRGDGHPCYCGLDQCWEQVASRTALDRMQSTWSGDEAGMWGEYAKRIASGLITLITIHHPEAVVISGSVAQHWERLRESLIVELACRPEFDAEHSLFASQLGPYGGAMGATLLARRNIGFGTRP
ncbi:MAG: ROK family protein [Candidatus Nanopelagicales bacterium]